MKNISLLKGRERGIDDFDIVLIVMKINGIKS
jgi:hypothetical protein